MALDERPRRLRKGGLEVARLEGEQVGQLVGDRQDDLIGGLARGDHLGHGMNPPEVIAGLRGQITVAAIARTASCPTMSPTVSSSTVVSTSCARLMVNGQHSPR